MNELAPFTRGRPNGTAPVLEGLDTGLLAEFERAAELLLRADREIALVARASPADANAASARLGRSSRAGHRREARRRAAVELSATRQLLGQMIRTFEPFGWLGRLHAARALELELEARMVEALETPAFVALAAERFPVPVGHRARACDRFVAEALREPAREPAMLHRSDDASDPLSLFSVVSKRARELGLVLKIDVRPEQVATAATGDGIIAIRPAVALSGAAAERIAQHELLGHALPRARAIRAPFRLFRAGTAGASDCEEGRALLVERRAGLLDAERRRELALRHRAALSVRDRAEAPETARLLEGLGAPPEVALDIARRAHRGGGLARELVYLPAYFEVTEALTENPALEAWLERGRLDLRAARLFAYDAGRLERGA